MTASHASPALPAHDLDAAIAGLRSHGLRVSAARRLVLQALFLADGPLSAEAIAAGVDGRIPPSDLGSTYRNLETLEHIGLVRHFHLGHGPGLYTVAARAGQEYLVCESCHSARAVPPRELDAVRTAIRDAFGHVASFSHFPIVGLCAACEERAGEPG
jgi:Fur family ferric uptake transcriptional regulator